MSKRLWIFGFFCDVNQNLKASLRKKTFMACDLWLVDFDPFCVFLCFKVCCFWTSKFGRVFLKSAVSFSLALSFFTFLNWNMANCRFPRWNCFYGASKSRRKSRYERVKTNRYVPANIYLCSFCSVSPPSFDKQGLDAIVTVWLTPKKTKTHDPETLSTTPVACYSKNPHVRT